MLKISTMDIGTGKHFCRKCGRLIRVGEQYERRGIPAAGRRRTDMHYWHGQCLSNPRR